MTVQSYSEESSYLHISYLLRNALGSILEGVCNSILLGKGDRDSYRNSTGDPRSWPGIFGLNLTITVGFL